MSWYYQVDHERLACPVWHPFRNSKPPQATPKELVDIQPTHLAINKPITKEEWVYLRQFHRLLQLNLNGDWPWIFDYEFEKQSTCLDRLKILVVYGDLSEESTAVLGRLMKQFTQLTTLDLQGNLYVMFPKLVPYMSGLTALQHLALWGSSGIRKLNSDGMRKVVSHLSTLTQLSHLHIENLVDEDSVLGLRELISSHPHLTTLLLSSNYFNPKSNEIVCQVISQLSGLTHLNLVTGNQDEASMTALGKAVAHLPLIHLGLDHTSWTSRGFDALVAQFEHWPHLISLNLYNNSHKITQEQTTQLALQLSKLTSLLLLDITFCSPNDYTILLEPLKSLPLQVLFLSAPKESETTLTQHFPSKCGVGMFQSFLIHDASLPTLQGTDVFNRYIPLLLPTKPVVESTPLPITPLYWIQFGTFRHINRNRLETYLMQPMLYIHLRYPEQVQPLWSQQDRDLSFFLECILLNQLPTLPDMETALKYHRWSEIVGYRFGLIHYADFIQQHLTPNNLISTFIYFHHLKKTVLPQRDASGGHVECTGEEDELVCWDGLLSYLVSKWKEWSHMEEMFTSCNGLDISCLLIKGTEDKLNVEWKMRDDVNGYWERIQGLFQTTTHFLHLPIRLRPNMTVVINNGLKVLHLHSHVVWKRWGLSTSHLNLFARRLGGQSPVNVIYHLELNAKVAELVGCLLEYCYTGNVDKLSRLTPFQIEMVGEMKETTIYSMSAWMENPPQLDGFLMNWCQFQLSNK